MPPEITAGLVGPDSRWADFSSMRDSGRVSAAVGAQQHFEDECVTVRFTRAFVRFVNQVAVNPSLHTHKEKHLSDSVWCYTTASKVNPFEHNLTYEITINNPMNNISVSPRGQSPSAAHNSSAIVDLLDWR